MEVATGQTHERPFPADLIQEGRELDFSCLELVRRPLICKVRICGDLGYLAPLVQCIFHEQMLGLLCLWSQCPTPLQLLDQRLI